MKSWIQNKRPKSDGYHGQNNKDGGLNDCVEIEGVLLENGTVQPAFSLTRLNGARWDADVLLVTVDFKRAQNVALVILACYRVLNSYQRQVSKIGDKFVVNNVKTPPDLVASKYR